MKSKWSRFSDIELETIVSSINDGCSFVKRELDNCGDKLTKQINKEIERRKLTEVADQ